MSPSRTNFTLVVLETSHIQQYIFNSNRLKENVGASYLVSAATETWVRDWIWESGLQHNLTETDFTEAAIEQQNLEVEVLYCGGGNAVLLFSQHSRALEFIGALSLRSIRFAPGLRLTFHHVPNLDWYQDPLSHAVSEALRTLKQQRSQQPVRLGLYGLSVTDMCASTSLPAVTMDQDQEGQWEAISAEVEAKRSADQLATKSLEALSQQVTSAPTRERLRGYRFALELDDLGRTEGESSYIAVVHADGNDMGKLIQGLQDKFPEAKHNRTYIRHMRWFSENVKKASRAAVGQMLDLLVQSIDEETQTIRGVHDQADIQLVRKNGYYILPIRPLVSGGDDITFVCDGRIGLDMAARFLEAFEQATANYLNERLTACAGVAIVNAHYPFARAYDLAEQLCQSAKVTRYQTQQMQSSLIDWHYTPGGLYADLDTMRQREYKVDAGMLCLRPLVINENAAEPYRTWPLVMRLATKFQTGWRTHRSKAKQLMAALRDGDAEAKAFLSRAVDGKEIVLPAVPGIQHGQTWLNNRCLYYDALELMDLYIPITQEAQDRVSQD